MFPTDLNIYIQSLEREILKTTMLSYIYDQTIKSKI